MGTAAADLLAELTGLGIELVAHADRLRYRPRSAVTPELVERLRSHKAELLAILGDTGGCEGLSRGPAPDHPERWANHPEGAPEPIRWEDCIEPPPACPRCGGLVWWWNPLGDRRCMDCDPPTTAITALERAERIRRRLGIPSPIGAAQMFAHEKRLTDA